MFLGPIHVTEFGNVLSRAIFPSGVFSRTERVFLKVLADSPPPSGDARLEQVFPNPVYRRKLMWGIRQKAGASLEDWRLYTEAARRDSRLLPREAEGAEASRPLFADPIVGVVESLKRTLRRRAKDPKAAAVPRPGRSR